MGIADSFKDKAEQAVDKIGGDRVKQGVEKAGDKIDEMTGGKFAGQVDKGQSAASDYVDKMDDDSNR
ncbi:antitoxin [Phytohabitans sp. ZYX-F-186]|uniref:Antitoxin n=1 Tax=Phytohabitans maris TaxID=3071409 RepID=A0ABU0ZTF3_9ACTN|nr:antitoxin [Phytohabitans sp. ZYX-F-186]MDQ7910318.1 antitoxin [Phytohabitans sp. ZYX-F-186]